MFDAWRRLASSLRFRWPKHPAKYRVDVGEMEIEVEIGCQFLFRQIFAYLRILLEPGQELTFAAPWVLSAGAGMFRLP